MPKRRCQFIPLESAYDGVLEVIDKKSLDLLVFNLFIRTYLVSGLSEPFGKRAHLKWSDQGWVKCSYKELTELLYRMWPDLEYWERTKVLRAFWENGSGHQWNKMAESHAPVFPVPSHGVAVTGTVMGVQHMPPWKFKRLPFRQHLVVDGKKDLGRAKIHIWAPPGVPRPKDSLLHDGIMHISSGIVNGIQCTLCSYKPQVISKIALDAFCELYGASWTKRAGIVEIAAVAKNNILRWSTEIHGTNHSY